MSTLRIPFHFANGKPAAVSGDYAEAAQYLRAVIMTRVGERVMRPRYGSHARDSVFEPISGTLIAEMSNDIMDAVAYSDPDIIINQISPQVYESRVEFEVLFSLRSTVTGSPESISVSIDLGGGVEETT